MTFTPIRMQIVLSAEPDRVFEALTDANALRAWFSEYAEIDLTQNRYDFWGRFTPTAPDREAGKHTIVDHVSGELLTFRWRAGEYDTRVTFRLHPHNKGTLLTLRQVPDGEIGSGPGVAEDFWFLSLENLRRYLDGKASDARVDFTNAMRGDIHHETEIDAPVHRVWQVLTEPDELNRWIATQATVQLEKGGLHSLGWIVDGTDYSATKIVDIVPDQKLALENPPMPGMSEKPTITTWEMKENNGKTWLTFTHSGFEADQDVSGLYTGWRNFVNWVRSVAEYGAAWYPPIPVLNPGMGYPASMYSAQDQIAEELRETA